MRWIVFLGALLMAACTQAQPAAAGRADVAPNTRGSLSPSAPVNLTYQVENGVAGQPQRIDIAISTRLTSGLLLVEVARGETVPIPVAAFREIEAAAKVAEEFIAPVLLL